MASSSKAEEQGSKKLSLGVENQQILNKGNKQIDVRAQLWLECVGFAVKIPHSRDTVFYFPQDHLEQVEACMKPEREIDIKSFQLPPRILCKVMDVQLKADVDTDEVFAEITLTPMERSHEPKRPTFKSVPQKVHPSFRKTLMYPDISTPKGCILNTKDAATTFPPLDESQDQASQELFAKDLQGNIWHFHHIRYGTPKRDILMTGWDRFLSKKKLIVGDTLIFTSGKNELYVGIQREKRVQKPSTEVYCNNMKHRILTIADLAIGSESSFRVYYRPWMSPWPFLVAYDEFMESLEVNFSPNMRFEMIFDRRGEYHEGNSIRLLGKIAAKEDIDPVMWPQSEWRSLKVSWDGLTYGCVVPERVSPWEIRPVNSTRRHRQPLLGHARMRSMPSHQSMFPNLPSPKMIASNNRMWGPQGQAIGTATTSTLFDVNHPSSSSQDRTSSAQVNHAGPKIKLFGVEICTTSTGFHSQPGTTRQNAGTSQQNSSNSIEVVKHGTALVKSIDLTHFIGYEVMIPISPL